MDPGFLKRRSSQYLKYTKPSPGGAVSGLEYAQEPKKILCILDVTILTQFLVGKFQKGNFQTDNSILKLIYLYLTLNHTFRN